MAGAEHRAGLSDDPAVERHDFRADLEGRRRLRDQIQEGRRIGPGVERDSPQVLAGDHRAVDQVRERDRA